MGIDSNNVLPRAVVVAQLVERLLPIPEVQGSNPVIGKIYIEHLFTCLLSSVLNRRKEAGNGPLFKQLGNISDEHT